MDQLLTIDAIRAAQARVRAVGPIVVGVACSPAIHQRIQGHDVPTLIDPRLNLAEVYHDREAWLDRCEEQAAWESLCWRV